MWIQTVRHSDGVPESYLRKKQTTKSCRITQHTKSKAEGGGLARGLRTKGSLVRDLAGSPFVVALSKSHLPPAA